MSSRSWGAPLLKTQGARGHPACGLGELRDALPMCLETPCLFLQAWGTQMHAAWELGDTVPFLQAWGTCVRPAWELGEPGCVLPESLGSSGAPCLGAWGCPALPACLGSLRDAIPVSSGSLGTPSWRVQGARGHPELRDTLPESLKRSATPCLGARGHPELGDTRSSGTSSPPVQPRP